MMKHHPASAAEVVDDGGVAALLDVFRSGNSHCRVNAAEAIALLLCAVPGDATAALASIGGAIETIETAAAADAVHRLTGADDGVSRGVVRTATAARRAHATIIEALDTKCIAVCSTMRAVVSALSVPPAGVPARVLSEMDNVRNTLEEIATLQARIAAAAQANGASEDVGSMCGERLRASRSAHRQLLEIDPLLSTAAGTVAHAMSTIHAAVGELQSTFGAVASESTGAASARADASTVVSCATRLIATIGGEVGADDAEEAGEDDVDAVPPALSVSASFRAATIDNVAAHVATLAHEALADALERWSATADALASLRDDTAAHRAVLQPLVDAAQTARVADLTTAIEDAKHAILDADQEVDEAEYRCRTAERDVERGRGSAAAVTAAQSAAQAASAAAVAAKRHRRALIAEATSLALSSFPELHGVSAEVAAPLGVSGVPERDMRAYSNVRPLEGSAAAALADAASVASPSGARTATRRRRDDGDSDDGDEPPPRRARVSESGASAAGAGAGAGGSPSAAPSASRGVHIVRRAELDGVSVVLKGYPLHDAASRAALEREIRVVNAIDHPAVIKVSGFAIESGVAPTAWVELPYAARGDLQAACSGGDAALPAWEVQSLMRQALCGLSALARAGIVHKDIKPGNLLRTGDGRLLITDFDIAKGADEATVTGGSRGTPGYMAPEVEAGGSSSHASDMYDIGVVLHELRFKQPPAPPPPDAMGEAGELAHSIPADAEEPLASLLKQLFARDPAARPSAEAALMHPYFTQSLTAGLVDRGELVERDRKVKAVRDALASVRERHHWAHGEETSIVLPRHGIVAAATNAFAGLLVAHDGKRLRRRLRVTFAGEMGVDAGGLTTEMYHLFFSSLAQGDDGAPALFEAPDGGTWLPARDADVEACRAVGAAMAKAAYDGRCVTAPLCPSLFSFLCGV
eukprot:CAMPEP_0203833790 /NCGR_PEP_ID=MMETSP0115-20131106/72835_1 /ASSEMBLY_ACC=CAM_ASM_000227 /TAXON_ID=33651 /ORGANISM="Bicosoecid sp, Strain ms1" /LENGTH=930 /DNA_ID=CAMNT_0050742863 /DNA_START=10 /DNA_END=2798 /DNA_ORIENTATION=-